MNVFPAKYDRRRTFEEISVMPGVCTTAVTALCAATWCTWYTEWCLVMKGSAFECE